MCQVGGFHLADAQSQECHSPFLAKICVCNTQTHTDMVEKELGIYLTVLSSLTVDLYLSILLNQVYPSKYNDESDHT